MIKLIISVLFLLSPLHTLFSESEIKYTHIVTPGECSLDNITTNQSIHILEIDPTQYELKPVKALDSGIGRESVLSISDRYGAKAAVNAGFFTIGGSFDGKACGALKIHEWYGLPYKPRGCIGWSSTNQNPKMDRLSVTTYANYDLNQIIINGMNRPRKKREIILYTPCFHRTTLTNPDGVEIVVVNGIIESIVKGGSTKIPENGFVLSIQKKHPLAKKFRTQKSLTITTEINTLTGSTSSDEWASLDYIVGGVPLLINNSEKVTDVESELATENFLFNKHSRTAIGILPNGHWIFVVVDKTEFAEGMTIDELIDLMAQFGCVHALNLDGGGSSTMVHNGVVKNSPHGDEDEGEGQKTVRRVSDAIVILPKK
ncbi:MAG: phosphodiester glycosidase family protein [Chlamydiae bacterium]|nr:phosphodiester glycosidase family protein [Chlamydiota bacterium]